MTGPPGPGHVTTGIGSPEMTKRNRDLAKRTGAFTAGSGQVTGSAQWPTLITSAAFAS